MKTPSRFECTAREQVPKEVLLALTGAIRKYAHEHPETYRHMHEYLTDEMRTAVESIKGWEGFCMCYRHENTPVHELCYALFSSVGANFAPKARA